MSKILIKRSDFIEAIEEIRKAIGYREAKNKFFMQNGVDGYVYEPECCDTAVRLLHLIFGEHDVENLIARYCFAGNFGKNKKECTFFDEEGKPHEISNSDELYDYLLQS